MASNVRGFAWLAGLGRFAGLGPPDDSRVVVLRRAGRTRSLSGATPSASMADGTQAVGIGIVETEYLRELQRRIEAGWRQVAVVQGKSLSAMAAELRDRGRAKRGYRKV
jgi:hypothetical protein